MGLSSKLLYISSSKYPENLNRSYLWMSSEMLQSKHTVDTMTEPAIVVPLIKYSFPASYIVVEAWLCAWYISSSDVQFSTENLSL